MYLDPLIITMFICMLLVVLGLLITIHLVEHANNSRESKFFHDEEYESFVNSEGFHSYYERSLIEKSYFHHSHPNTPMETLRTFRRLWTWQ